MRLVTVAQETSNRNRWTLTCSAVHTFLAGDGLSIREDATVSSDALGMYEIRYVLVPRCALAENECLLLFTMYILNTSDWRSVCFSDIPFLLMIGSEHQCRQSRVEGDFTAVCLQKFGNVEDDNNRFSTVSKHSARFLGMFVRSYCRFFWRGTGRGKTIHCAVERWSSQISSCFLFSLERSSQ